MQQMQHQNVKPLNTEQRKAYAADLRKLATPQAQAATVDPVTAAEHVAYLASLYEQPAAEH